VKGELVRKGVGRERGKRGRTGRKGGKRGGKGRRREGGKRKGCPVFLDNNVGNPRDSLEPLSISIAQ